MASWPCAIALGPRGTHALKSPQQYSAYRIPAPARRPLNERAVDILDLALGPNDSFSAVYIDANGKAFLSHDGLPPALQQWLVSNGKLIRDAASLRIVLGPNGSWFAHDRSAYASANLPAGLTRALRAPTARDPLHVTLGGDGTYVGIFSDGSAAWALTDDLDPLGDVLRGSGDATSLRVFLSPFDSESFVILSSAGVTGGYMADGDQIWQEHWASFENDWAAYARAAGVRELRREQRWRTGVGLLGAVARVAGVFGSSGGAGGTVLADNNGYQSFDLSGFWGPLQDAATDPIQ